MAMQSNAILDLPGQVSANAAGGIAQYACVAPDTAGNPFDMIYPSGTGAFALGVCQSVGGPPVVGGAAAPVNTSGQSINVRILGMTKALAAAAITAGSYVQVSGASGQVAAVTFPGTGATNTYVLGYALTGATGANDQVTVLLIPGLTTQVTA